MKWNFCHSPADMVIYFLVNAVKNPQQNDINSKKKKMNKNNCR